MRNIHDDAQGRWKGLLMGCGVPGASAILSGKHMPCPMCGGTDRFRYSDYRGRGDYYCSKCGPGTGVDLLMKLQSMSFVQATEHIRSMLHVAPVQVAKAESRDSSKNYIDHIWLSAEKLSGEDPASLYLRKRAIDVSGVLEVKCARKLKYADKGQMSSTHWAMVSRFLSPGSDEKTLHITYVTDDGHRAPVAKPKKLAPGPVPKGGAVRLSRSAETLGIAEGIETAISAHRLFGVPVWAALSAGCMTKWEPPPHVKCVMIFGDNDASYAGQSAAYQLAHRLRVEGRHVDVRIPDELDTDWNDVLVSNSGVN